ncbi:SDR family NAD(P)-dependent oxidoreductase [Sphingomonas corticis]|uniref:SDR family NAD(P)-dependent oxidoreductase n=1 Tax=Sphingomonas corticis TaxID=2722791 RepID=A0ABX1CTQ3_9SPHN|nr:SDR family NAD(P)-dependent oxidoreductase [Sphingomonas corticis]NJR80013.1 SDR family NAD(P)-dependent oxidoreductase [Sphingomonas corticis]
MPQRSIFITGGAGGIGLATALRFASAGWRVGVGDLADALGGLPVGFERYVHDVTDADAWTDVLTRFSGSSDGAIDVLVNNAGILRFGWFEEQTAAAHAALVDVNVKGVVLGAGAALPFLRSAAGGCLINIASLASLQATPRLAVYSATKFAVRGLSEALALEWERLGVRVACVEPALIDTPMLDHDDAGGLSFRRAVGGADLLSAEMVADAVWSAAHGDDLHYPVGAAPEALLQEIAPRLAFQRRQWRERLAAPSQRS